MKQKIKGQYAEAIVYTDNIDKMSIEQITDLCDQKIFENSKVRIMPDVHAGKGSVIGFTSTFKDKIIPNIVGVDIGCGMLTTKLGNININLEGLDDFIRSEIPNGFEVNNYENEFVDTYLNDMKCKNYLRNFNRIRKSLGTLGGGNHFIEVNIDTQDNKYLVIHSGSRNLGLQVAQHYQNLSFKKSNSIKENELKKLKTLIEKLKKEGRQEEIPAQIKLLKKQKTKIGKDLTYLEGNDTKDYLHDMQICMDFASESRKIMAQRIIDYLGIYEKLEWFETIHNYIDLKNNIIRKGAVSAQKGEKILIPLNMRDGSIIAIGKGNEDWNCSAPHGAGRIMSRTEAKKILSMEKYEKEMNGIYTTSVCENTLDEAPMTYKNKESIVNNIIDTVEILEIIKPIYNFKNKG